VALTRSMGAYDDGTPLAPGIGTTPIDLRKSLSALWASAGVVAGGPSPLVTGTTGFTYSVAGPVPLVTTRGASDGFAMFTNDGAATIACPGAPGSGLQRIDIVWVRHPTNTENSDSSSMPIFGVASGTAVSSGPAAPSIPTGALELARNTMTSAATSTASTGNTISQTAAVAVLRGALPLLGGGTWTLASNETIPSGTFMVMTADIPSGTPAAGMFTSTSAGAFVVAQAGTYEVTVQARWANASAARFGIHVTKNCTSIDGSGNLTDGAIIDSNGITHTADFTHHHHGRPIDLAAGDTLRVFVYQASGAAEALMMGSVTSYMGQSLIDVRRVG